MEARTTKNTEDAMIKIKKSELRDLILNGITTAELNSKYDYSGITDMSYMFSMFCDSSSLESVPLFDTSNVTNMNYMFCDCSSLKYVPAFNTSNVTTMKHMFANCTSLKDIDPYDFEGFNFSTLDNNYLKEQYPEMYI